MKKLFRFKIFTDTTDYDVYQSESSYLYHISVFDKDTGDLIANRYTNSKMHFQRIANAYKDLGYQVRAYERKELEV